LFRIAPDCHTRPVTGPADPLRRIPYAGDALDVLGECAGMAVCEMAVPAGFPGPPPHIHHGFDEAIYVLDGELLVVTGRSDARPAPAGTLVLAARGTRHTFRNPTDRPVRVLGIWSPGSALGFMADVGAALPASGPPDPAQMAEVYRRHNSEVAP
jgi:mannose-6-phosphate isomerase-like protein (cupin superfamily)